MSDQLLMFEGPSSQELTLSLSEALAKTLAWLESVKVSPETAAPLCLKQYGSLTNADQVFLFGKTLKEHSAQTLDTLCAQAVVKEDRIRRLTPIECERLQGFPDNHTEYGNYDGEVKKMSNTQRYKQCGNAVTVDIVALVAEAVKPLFK